PCPPAPPGGAVRAAAPRELDRELDGRVETAWIGAPAPGDVERGAVVDRSAHDRQAERYVHRVTEAGCFKRWQTLIVIHREYRIELALSYGQEGRIGRHRAGELHPGAAQASQHRCDDLG